MDLAVKEKFPGDITEIEALKNYQKTRKLSFE